MNHNKNLNLTKDHSPRKTRRKMRPEQVKSSVLTLDNIKQWNGLKSHQAFQATLRQRWLKGGKDRIRIV